MADEKKNLDVFIDESERLGVIGSPSSTSQLSLDILGSAVTRKLVGELALFRYNQDASDHYALGQITEVQLRNVWHEDPTMRSLIRQRGRVDAVSERQDTHLGGMTVSAVFRNSPANRYEASILGTVPSTGTPIHLVSDDMLNTILHPYRAQIFYLGQVFGSVPKLPLWFKHFGSDSSGVGEAYHIGIFGKTGSGKSVLAKMILIAYAKHTAMGLFVLDPMGEFSLGLRDPTFPSDMGRILSPAILDTVGRRLELYDLDKIQLDKWEVLIELLIEFGFFFDLGIKHSDYQTTIADYVEDLLRRSDRYTLSRLDDQVYTDVLNHIEGNIHRVYGGGTGIERVQGFINEAKASLQQGESHPVKEKWDRTIRFFRYREGTSTPRQIISEALVPSEGDRRPMIVVDLSKRPQDISQDVWDRKIKPLLIDRFLWTLVSEAERRYHEQESLNTLVVLDEAHRLAPQERAANERLQRIKSRLVDAVRTTRKFGLGWMFLSQTLSSLDSEIVGQLRISFFGFGLSVGAEFQKLRQLAAEDETGIRLYQRFKDPQSAFDPSSKEFSFMTIGPVSPLSFSGTPLFLNAYNTVDAFLSANGLDK